MQSEKDTHPTRECPFCAETIQRSAKVCPHCRTWLSMKSYRHPLISLLGFGVPAFGCGIIMLFFIVDRVPKLLNPPPYYSQFRESLRILDSKMKWTETSDGSRLFLIGTVTNQSSVGWKYVEFECRFYNASGGMIDAANSTGYFTVLPGCDSAFRISVKPMLTSNEYQSFKLFVSTARNSGSGF